MNVRGKTIEEINDELFREYPEVTEKDLNSVRDYLKELTDDSTSVQYTLTRLVTKGEGIFVKEDYLDNGTMVTREWDLYYVKVNLKQESDYENSISNKNN